MTEHTTRAMSWGCVHTHSTYFGARYIARHTRKMERQRGSLRDRETARQGFRGTERQRDRGAEGQGDRRIGRKSCSDSEVEKKKMMIITVV